jgi:hypothetical protein
LTCALKTFAGWTSASKHTVQRIRVMEPLLQVLESEADIAATPARARG